MGVKRHARQEVPHSPAIDVSYRRIDDRVVIVFSNGTTFSAPRAHLQDLADVEPDDPRLNDVVVKSDGEAIDWVTLDIGFRVEGLLLGRLGSESWLAERGFAYGTYSSCNTGWWSFFRFR